MPFAAPNARISGAIFIKFGRAPTTHNSSRVVGLAKGIDSSITGTISTWGICADEHVVLDSRRDDYSLNTRSMLTRFSENDPSGASESRF